MENALFKCHIITITITITISVRTVGGIDRRRHLICLRTPPPKHATLTKQTSLASTVARASLRSPQFVSLTIFIQRNSNLSFNLYCVLFSLSDFKLTQVRMCVHGSFTPAFFGTVHLLNSVFCLVVFSRLTIFNCAKFPQGIQGDNRLLFHIPIKSQCSSIIVSCVLFLATSRSTFLNCFLYFY